MFDLAVRSQQGKTGIQHPLKVSQVLNPIQEEKTDSLNFQN